MVEFQPSSWGKGSYLNVAAMWLWNAKDYWSFDDGGRIETFRKFNDADQFAPIADELASRARDEVLALCRRFPSVTSVALYLESKSDDNPWHNYHAAMAALATENHTLAHARFDALLKAEERAPWITDLKSKVRGLIQHMANATTLSTVVVHEVELARTMLKLSSVDPSLLWSAAR